MSLKKTLVLGASPNPERYGYKATAMLIEYKQPVLAFGIKPGNIEGQTIITELPKDHDLNTITLYVGPANQPPYYDYILNQKPVRVIFNPGTENPEFERQLTENGIEALRACTLVLLRTSQY